MHWPLTPQDDALLTAKAIAFRTLSALDSILFVSTEGSEDHSGREAIISAIWQLSSFKQLRESTITVPVFLSTALDHLLDAIKKNCVDVPTASTQFAKIFRYEASTYISIVADMQRWLHSLSSFTLRYLNPQQPVAPITLQVRVDPQLSVRISGSTVPASSGREIILVVNPSAFEMKDYFSLPCVLSHEFWCHGISSLVDGERVPAGPQWKGCAPNDAWEEGWMDFVQGELLVAELPTLAAQMPAMHSHIVRHSREYLSGRQSPSRGMKLADGVAAADTLLKILRQYYHGSGDELFLQLSIGLNALNCSKDYKLRLVHIVREKLIPKCASTMKELAALTMNRHEFHEMLKPFIKFNQEDGSYTIDIEGFTLAVLVGEN